MFCNALSYFLIRRRESPPSSYQRENIAAPSPASLLVRPKAWLHLTSSGLALRPAATAAEKTLQDHELAQAFGCTPALLGGAVLRRCRLETWTQTPGLFGKIQRLNLGFSLPWGPPPRTAYPASFTQLWYSPDPRKHLHLWAPQEDLKLLSYGHPFFLLYEGRQCHRKEWSLWAETCNGEEQWLLASGSRCPKAQQHPHPSCSSIAQPNLAFHELNCELGLNLNCYPQPLPVILFLTAVLVDVHWLFCWSCPPSSFFVHPSWTPRRHIQVGPGFIKRDLEV